MSARQAKKPWNRSWSAMLADWDRFGSDYGDRGFGRKQVRSLSDLLEMPEWRGSTVSQVEPPEIAVLATKLKPKDRWKHEQPKRDLAQKVNDEIKRSRWAA